MITRWVIYDSYVAYETAKELAEEREMKKEAKDIKVILMMMTMTMMMMKWAQGYIKVTQMSKTA